MAKVKNKKAIKKNEFRKQKDNGHPANVYERQGNMAKIIGLTHSAFTDGEANIMLSKNPDPNDKRTAYMLANPIKTSYNRLAKKEKGWKFSKEDYDKVNKVKNSPIKNDRPKRPLNGRATQHGQQGTGCDYGMASKSLFSQRSEKSLTKTKANVKSKKRGGKK